MEETGTKSGENGQIDNGQTNKKTEKGTDNKTDDKTDNKRTEQEIEGGDENASKRLKTGS